MNVRSTNSKPELIIEAGRSEQQYWKDLWRYRDLFCFFVWRDILIRYKQTAIGILWALIRPFLTMVVFTIVFGRLAKLPSEGVPYPILVFSAMLPWQFFSNSLSECSNSLISNSNLISKEPIQIRSATSHTGMKKPLDRANGFS
jgi:lipopolysaccharide transport system permease protein